MNRNLTINQVLQEAKYALLQEFVRDQNAVTQFQKNWEAHENIGLDTSTLDMYLIARGEITNEAGENERKIARAFYLSHFMEDSNACGGHQEAIDWWNKQSYEKSVRDAIEFLFFQAFRVNGFDEGTRAALMKATEEIDSTHNMGRESKFIRAFSHLVMTLMPDEEWIEIMRKHRED